MADAAALVVDGDQEVRAYRAQLVREAAHLPRVTDVAGEEDDPAEATVDELLERVRHARGAVESGDETAVGGFVQVDGEAGRPGDACSKGLTPAMLWLGQPKVNLSMDG
ncbi:hypothetical protein WKI71_33875 [Streptomyces sp. MS1.AVA.1]|uniref:DUF222 domain-containing protein n=1 Tax=Streptomyces machairae TaxID=3134109 RepID=A0ABU8URL5_9ACTN